MRILKKLFRRKTAPAAVIPPWEEIVEHLQGKQLTFYDETVVRVITSKDRSKRILITKSENGFFKAIYEEIRVSDEEEWTYFCNDKCNRYPAWWEPVSATINTTSFYGTEEEAMHCAFESIEYRTYFA